MAGRVMFTGSPKVERVYGKCISVMDWLRLLLQMAILHLPPSKGPETQAYQKRTASAGLPRVFIPSLKSKGKQASLRKDHRITLPDPPDLTCIRHDCEILSVLGQTQQVKQFIGGLLTLTGKDGVVKAMRCDDFLSKYYGNIGRELLDCICRAIEDSEKKYDGADMKLEISESEVVLHHHPRIPSAVIGDALCWMCLALRVTPENGIHASFQQGRRLSPLRLQQEPAGDNIASCWHNLFETAVVVTQENSQSVLQYCLELHSGIMIQLAAVQYPVNVGRGLVLRGYSTALTPIERLSNRKIKWHLEVNTKGSQFKVSDLQMHEKKWYPTLASNDLRGTALLGWSSKAEVLLGTEMLPCQVTWSSTQRKYHRWELNNINLQAVAQSTVPFQIGGQAGFSFQRIPNTVRFSPSKNYAKLLVDSFNEPMILSDTVERRAWLVSKLSVFHHMVLAYCKSAGVKENHPLASPEDDGGSASFRTLLEWSEKDLVGHGGVALRVHDLVLGFSASLSKTVVNPPKGAEVYGYEFMDIVHTTTAAELRKAHLKRDELVWKPLLKNIECLFCNNLGDAIVALRSSELSAPCNRLLKDRDLLAASMFCVDEISKREGIGNGTSTRRFPGSHLWELWGDPFTSCSHAGKAADCWNNNSFIQEISKEKRKFLDTYHETLDNPGKTADHAGPKVGGVVVFGESRAKAA
ncbi:uncharacterized protein BDV17DRAFT_197936 [Aspergillus undulatus]|uniref:uncharacterized protein n=1 Tax=Aspergillus undulatus TaxID=1810928 RepID=UPI003CCD1FDD